MAGRGDVSVLRLCRRLRARIPTPPRSSPPALTHGGQMAVHCTIGLLFLGGGRSTLSSTPEAVAALLAAFFPKFPTHSEDNRYHLQAFRHLYVLAVESRLILPRDLDTGKLCYAHIQVIDLEGVVREMKAPCMIPELSGLREVRVNDPRYWPITFHRDHNWDQLKRFLEYTWCIDIEQRAGCLSYLADPLGLLTVLAHTLTLDRANVWAVAPTDVQLFTNDDKVKNFVKHYLAKESTASPSICASCQPLGKRRGPAVGERCACRQYSAEEQEHVQSLSVLTYECVVRDVLCALPVWTAFLKILKTMKSEPTSYHTWQMKLLQSQTALHGRRAARAMAVDGEEGAAEGLVSAEFALAVKQKLCAALDRWTAPLAPHLAHYLGMASPGARRPDSAEEGIKQKLAAYVTYHELPRGALREWAAAAPLWGTLGAGAAAAARDLAT